jgi:hypothetical protein
MGIEQQGWAFPTNLKKAHYFERGQMISICGRIMNTGERFDDMHEHEDNCAECKRRYKKKVRP